MTSEARREHSRKTLGLLSLFLCASILHSNAEWRNSLKPAGKAPHPVTVVKKGTAVARIYIPANATGPEKKAAADLQKWIEEITGTKLSISQQKRGAVIELKTDPSLGEEGYSIQTGRRRLTLSGGTGRGVPNAVYALLEEDLGCRFYARDSIRLPKTNTLVIAAVPRQYVPKLKIRDPFYACAFDPVWSLRNRSNAPDAAVPEDEGGHMDYGPMFVHTANRMVPPDKYFKDHPDYFAQRADGTRSTAQLCPTHPDVASIAIEYVKNALKTKPHTEILSVSKNDNTEICHCERCKKLRDAEGSDMANQLHLVNQVAEAIEKDHPEVIIDTLAYLETIQVPKTIRPRRNVAIRLCNDSVGAWSTPFAPAEQCPVAQIAKAWGEAHNRIYVWDYNVNFSHYLAPMPNLDVMASNIRFWIAHNAEGVMLQGGYQGPAERDELKCWVTAKLLWNPAWDEKALAEDFILGHYGKAAAPVLKYESLLNEQRHKFAKDMATPAGGIRYGMDAAFLNKEFVDQGLQLLEEARKLAEDDELLQRRVERAQLPLLYVLCVRGPSFSGPSFAKAVEEFERIGKAERVRYLAEGDADFDRKLEGYKKQLAKP